MVFDFSIKRKFISVYFLLSLLSSFSACTKAQEEVDKPIKNANRIIEFSGYKWLVRDSKDKKQGPGPNFFSNSEENVWVDESGRLHLKLVEREGIWYCSEVTLRRSYGFNKYVFYVSSSVDQLDENVVGGLLTYMNDEEEIDIEFSKWSDPENENSQFAVQPAYLPGNKKRFDLNLKNNLSTHFFNWQKDKIEFASYRGHTLNPTSEAIIKTWAYTGNNIPPDTNEKLKINLWLFRGAAPTNSKNIEMIIDHIEIY